MWQPPERNFDKIQFESLRRSVDAKFNQVHDELSDCFYNGKPFRTFGVLTKEQFDKLHGLIFLMRDVDFNKENLKLPKKDQISVEAYDWVDDVGTVKKSDFAALKILELKNTGLELVI